MTPSSIARRRLGNQRISKTAFTRPEQVVKWLGAVQAQDYAAAKWAVGLRAHGLTDSGLDQALADGTLLRTHVMRPTWHFVSPEDIRWLLALTAPRVHAANAYPYRTLELDPATFLKSNAALARALRDGKQLTRDELASALQRAGIDASGLRLNYLIMHAELDGVICSGARRGKQFTYALFEERVPASKPLEHEEALAELARRYFTSREPATEQDFMWWSGLSRADVRRGIELVRRDLAKDTIEGKTYWFAASTQSARDPLQSVYLLPNLDEYVVGYTDRSAIFDSSRADQLDARSSPLFQHTIVVHGQIAGTWKRTLGKDSVTVEAHPFAQWEDTESRAIELAAQRYGEFLELPSVLVEMERENGERSLVWTKI